MWKLAGQLWHDRSAATMMVFALAAPVLMGGVGAAVEYIRLAARQTELQKAADVGAISGAKELMLANADEAAVAEIASAAVRSNLSGGHDGVAIRSKILDDRSRVEVRLDEVVTGVFGKLLSYPSAQLSATAAAKLSGKDRLCLLALDPAASKTVSLEMSARLTAEQCAVHSNSKNVEGIKAMDLAVLKSVRTCTAGGYTGKAGTNFMPTPITDCPAFSDPLADRSPPSGSGCDHNNLSLHEGSRVLRPGVYCGGLKLTGGPSGAADVSLEPGTYIIKDGPLTVEKGASLRGEYTGFYFQGADAVLDFKSQSTISLSAPKTGPLVGLLFFEDRTAPLLRKFVINSDNARKLLGTIYLPNAVLAIDARRPIADLSAYTVIIARQVRLSSGPNLVLNANYGSTDIPVPKGVGPTSGTVSLAQ